jgi:hypothetical protein
MSEKSTSFKDMPADKFEEGTNRLFDDIWPERKAAHEQNIQKGLNAVLNRIHGGVQTVEKDGLTVHKFYGTNTPEDQAQANELLGDNDRALVSITDARSDTHVMCAKHGDMSKMLHMADVALSGGMVLTALSGQYAATAFCGAAKDIVQELQKQDLKKAHDATELDGVQGGDINNFDDGPGR